MQFMFFVFKKNLFGHPKYMFNVLMPRPSIFEKLMMSVYLSISLQISPNYKKVAKIAKLVLKLHLERACGPF